MIEPLLSPALAAGPDQAGVHGSPVVRPWGGGLLLCSGACIERSWRRPAPSRGIAQPGSAGVLGTPGRRFKSCCPDQSFGRHMVRFCPDRERAVQRECPAVNARIYKPAKTAMQSGTAKTKEWVLDFEPEQASEIGPLMGGTSSGA